MPNLKGERTEAEIEKDVSSYARSKGWLTPKWTSPGTHGVTDRIFISPKGQIVFVEFKSAKGKLTSHQSRFIQTLLDRGLIVKTINSMTAGMKLVDETE